MGMMGREDKLYPEITDSQIDKSPVYLAVTAADNAKVLGKHRKDFSAEAEKVATAVSETTDNALLTATLLELSAWGYSLPHEALTRVTDTAALDEMLRVSAAFSTIERSTTEREQSLANVNELLHLPNYSPSNEALMIAMEAATGWSSNTAHLELLAVAAKNRMVEIKTLDGSSETVSLVNSPTSDGILLLLKAAKKNPESASVLFENGADPRRTVRGESVLDLLSPKLTVYKEIDAYLKKLQAVEERRAVGVVDVEVAHEVAKVQLNAAKQLMAAQNDNLLALMNQLVEMKKVGIDLPTSTVTALLTQAIPGAANKQPEDPNVIDVEYTAKSTAATATGDLQDNRKEWVKQDAKSKMPGADS